MPTSDPIKRPSGAMPFRTTAIWAFVILLAAAGAAVVPAIPGWDARTPAADIATVLLPVQDQAHTVVRDTVECNRALSFYVIEAKPADAGKFETLRNALVEDAQHLGRLAAPLDDETKIKAGSLQQAVDNWLSVADEAYKGAQRGAFDATQYVQIERSSVAQLAEVLDAERGLAARIATRRTDLLREQDLLKQQQTLYRYGGLALALLAGVAAFALARAASRPVSGRGRVIDLAFLRGILDRLPDGIAITDPDGRIIVSNLAAGRVAERSADDRRLQLLGSEGQPLDTASPLDRALAGEPVSPCEVQIERFDGTLATVEVAVETLQEDGVTRAAVVTMRDRRDLAQLQAELADAVARVDLRTAEMAVLEQKLRATEAKLHEATTALAKSAGAEDRLTQVITHTDAIGIIVFDKNMRLSEANEAGLRLMGERRRQRDVRGMLLSEIVPGTTSGLPTLFRKAINNNQPFSSDAYECDGLRHGTAMWRFAIVPIQGTDADGAAAAALLGVDITEAVSERRALEESLQKERATTAALLDTLDVAVLVADAETSTVRFCNTAATTLGAPSSGATKGALVAEFADAWKLTAGGAPLPVDAFPLNRALRGENLIRGEFDSKGRSLTVSAVAVRGEDHRVIGGLLVAAEQPGRDVGEAAPVEAVAPAAGPAGFETLLRAVARNLATPIQAIDGMVNLFKDHYADAIPDVTALHYLELTRRNVESMSQLVTALGELASLAEREPSPTDVPLSAAVEEAWRSKPRGSAELRVEGPLPIVRADRGMLVRALTEVFDVGGLFRDGAGSTVVSVRARDLGNKWEIEVDDTGRGFRAEDAELLFGPLAQTIGDSTSTSIGGLGVGLAAARRITQLHGGEAGARASEKGAVYSLTFGK